MVRLDRIYTGGGDAGETSLGDGTRVSKLDARIAAGGAVDETSCALGLALTCNPPAPIAEIINPLQQLLFDLGADLCVPLPAADQKDLLPARISAEHVQRLERLIDHFTDQLQPLSSFVLPGGTQAAACLHMARAVCRRAEVDALRLQQQQTLNPHLLIALNRLSDLLFVMARAANNNGQSDVLWQPGAGLPPAPAAS
ncbi:MAG TPA: cob(I)yrinic acid a,c-diamide adenosyltransferase [Planctomycetaceae bacterium]|nr:cob(I)yrinic acid a,c-diamide adenosyltransferase [Planctomycetaceae bacterium]